MERKPEWLKIKFKGGAQYSSIKKTVEEKKLHTICSSGKCPNIGHCWGIGSATFMIMGEICTRCCRFCATKTGKPLPLDPAEPEKVADSILQMKLSHCVITSVDRDDLPDKGADHWKQTVLAIKKINPQTTVELLIPDYEETLLDIVLESQPDIVAHNLETVERITPSIRSKAQYQQSLKVIEKIAKKGFIAKTGIMVGLGETEEEVITLMKACIGVGCSMMTIGQYLQPTTANIEVVEYVTPLQFEKYKKIGAQLGFKNIESAPLVRSSYMAEKSFHQLT
ncbi:MAG: lipoyl synthase [Bacteroidales bacterium]|nr:lipoyl synthase [Bacteroidales bacterium]